MNPVRNNRGNVSSSNHWIKPAASSDLGTPEEATAFPSRRVRLLPRQVSQGCLFGLFRSAGEVFDGYLPLRLEE